MYTGEKLGKAISQAIEMKGVSKADVARHFGIKPPSVTGWLKTGRIGKEHLSELVAYFSDVVTPEHFGIGYYDTNAHPGPDVFNEVPLISWVQAGHWSEAIDLLQPGEGERIPTTYRPRRHTYALRVSGDSMEPEFTEGDIIIVEPDETPSHGSYVVVRQNGGEATFKKLVVDGSKTYLAPLNNRYPVLELKEDAAFCGVIKEKIKRY